MLSGPNGARLLRYMPCRLHCHLLVKYVYSVGSFMFPHFIHCLLISNLIHMVIYHLNVYVGKRSEQVFCLLVKTSSQLPL